MLQRFGPFGSLDRPELVSREPSVHVGGRAVLLLLNVLQPAHSTGNSGAPVENETLGGKHAAVALGD